MKTGTIIGILLALTLLSSFAISHWVTREDARANKFVDMDVTYPVRDVFRGYEGGWNIIIVEYYDGYSIRTVDNQRRFDGRVNSIVVRKSLNNNSYLHWYATNPPTYWKEVHRELYPRNKYILYLADDLACTGVKTHTPHADRADYESFIE